MFIDLAIWYLLKRKASVLINVKITGGVVQQTTRRGYTYNNDLDGTKYLDKNGDELNLPSGAKFSISYPDKV